MLQAWHTVLTKIKLSISWSKKGEWAANDSVLRQHGPTAPDIVIDGTSVPFAGKGSGVVILGSPVMSDGTEEADVDRRAATAWAGFRSRLKWFKLRGVPAVARFSTFTLSALWAGFRRASGA